MEAKCSIASAIVWNWVIEALASSEQTDISTLIGLVKMAPAISGDAGKHTREIVSLRILESLFDHGNDATMDAKISNISFDFSESCEDVLKKTLHETPVQINKLEKEKWDVGPFLKRKRSSLPECALKKLKEAVLDDSNLLFASLKEKGKLVTSNASEDTIPDTDNDFQENTLQDDITPQETYTESDSKRASVENMVNLEFIVNAEDSNKIVQQNLELPSISGKDNNGFQEIVLQDDNKPQETYTERDNKSVSVENMENLEFVNSKDSNNIVQTNTERFNDYDDDERTDIAAKKESFLKSQCTSQDSLTLTEWSEIDLCMKCNKRGELLVCSSDTCPLQFHESCLGFAPILEESGVFFCPFCAYSRAISKYQEAKKHASLARKNLQAFSSFTVLPDPSKSPAKQSVFEENEERLIGVNDVNCMFNEKDTGLPDPLMPDVNEEDLNNEDVNDDDDGDDDPSVELTTELPIKLIPEPTTPKQKCKHKESQRSTKPGLNIRLRKRKAKHTPPPVPLVRRKKLPWTKSEEETLKEGVERYSSGDNSKIPWKEILDFGHKVFHKGRTTIDLKDKWRNICK